MVRWCQTRIMKICCVVFTVSYISIMYTMSGRYNENITEMGILTNNQDEHRQLGANYDILLPAENAKRLIEPENNDHPDVSEGKYVELEQEAKKQSIYMEEQDMPRQEKEIKPNEVAQVQSVNNPNEEGLEILKNIKENNGHPVKNSEPNIIAKYAKTIEASVNLKPNILLLTYLRSGSSFTGAIFQRSPDVFYMFEPIGPLLHSMNHGDAYFTLDTVCSSLGECRKPQSPQETFVFVSEIIKNLYRCNRTMITNEVIETIINLRLSKIRERIQECYNRTHDKKTCLDETFYNCSNRVRVVKFIRLSAEVVGKLMTYVPNLKVIHLLRDPRGMLKSRVSVGLLPVSKYDNSSAQTCEQMLKDIEVMKTLKNQYPGRIKTVLYEDLAENPVEGAKQLYDFTGLKFNDEIKQYVKEITSAKESNSAYGITRSNSTEVAHQWRKQISLKHSKLIDQRCQGLYNAMGLRAADSVERLRDTNYPLRDRKRDLGDYLMLT